MTTGKSLYRLDGMTGNAYPAYTSASGANLATPVVRTNGTIFTVDGSSVVGINPTTGLPNFSVAMQNSTLNGVSQASSPSGTAPVARTIVITGPQEIHPAWP